jgi:hypothetical protein
MVERCGGYPSVARALTRRTLCERGGLSRKREREPSPDAEASFTPSAIALGHLVIDHRNADRVVAA